MRILHEFDYERPRDLHAALELMARHGDRARPIAGGTDLVIGMKYRSILQLADAGKFSAASRAPKVTRPDVVVSLSGLSELKGIAVDPDAVVIGPGTTMAEIARRDDLPAGALALVDAAAAMGSPLIRNRATIGGNLVHARPAADTAVAGITLGADLVLASTGGRRTVAAADFFTGPGETVKRPDELLVAIRLPQGPGEGSAYCRQGTRRQLEIALASAAAWVSLDPDSGEVSDARIGLGAVGPTPLLAPQAANTLIGSPPDADHISGAAAAARSEIKPIDDYRGSAAYRVEIVGVLVRRALETAVARARGREAS
ncbi:MAG: xanthine dehydrogenase family protein subunit M [Candidatus Latescibacterota bacterium]|jgi:carbon-monoxide dehydrogenase medium subunit